MNPTKPNPDNDRRLRGIAKRRDIAFANDVRRILKGYREGRSPSACMDEIAAREAEGRA